MPRTHLQIVLLFLALMIGRPTASLARETATPAISGFLTASIGIYKVSFDDQIMSDVFRSVYSTESGTMIGVECGVGSVRRGIYGMLKYRFWHKTIPYSVAKGWRQNLVGGGLRYFATISKKTFKPIKPLVGGGVVVSTVDYGGDNLDGMGFYFEGGLDYQVDSRFSIRSTIEWYSVNLGSDDEGTRYDLSGGGGLFIGIGVSYYLNLTVEK